MLCPACHTENAPNASECVHCESKLIANPGPPPVLPPLPHALAGQPPTMPSPPPFAPAGPPPIPTMPANGIGQVPQAYPSPYGAPPPGAPQPYTPEPGILETFVPGRNPKALIGYYLAVFSIIPILGIALGIAAFILGMMGLKEAKRNPAIKGKTHAWVAIVLGGLFGFGYLIFVVWGVVLVMLSSSHTNF